jgi:HSP20 family protein
MSLRRLAMGVTPVEVKKTPASRASSDPWYIFRSEIDRLFDRFSGSGAPSMRRLFEPSRSVDETFGFNAPAVDVTEDEKAFKVAAELPGLDEKDVEVALTGDILTIKGEKRQEKEEKNKTGTSRSAPMAHSSAPSRCRRASTATRSPPSSPRAS